MTATHLCSNSTIPGPARPWGYQARGPLGLGATGRSIRPPGLSALQRQVTNPEYTFKRKMQLIPGYLPQLDHRETQTCTRAQRRARIGDRGHGDKRTWFKLCGAQPCVSGTVPDRDPEGDGPVCKPIKRLKHYDIGLHLPLNRFNHHIGGR